jgi:uncharacterized protein
MIRVYLILACVLLTASSLAAAPKAIWVGVWVGHARTSGEETSIELRIAESGEHLVGTLSLKDVGVTGWPVSSIEASADTLHIELPSDSGIQKMVLVPMNGDLQGVWQEPDRDEAAIVYVRKSTSSNRVLEKRILVNGPAGKIGASIIVPNKRGLFPAIVFLHGSGPQSRDANRFAAFRFAELGIASIFYDKRGVGESEGILEGTTFEALAADAIAAAEYMLSQTNVSTVGFSGHSQGGWVSTLAGSIWPQTGFVITSAGPAVPPAREAHWTVIRAMRNKGESEQSVEQARKVIEIWHDGIRTGDWTAFDRFYVQAEKQAWFKNSGLSDFAEKPSEARRSSYRAYMDYDPIPAIESLKAPYLAMLSPDDESIDAVETKNILEKLLRTNISLRMYPGYDHSMRKLGKKGIVLRWPEHPEDYFVDQSRFVSDSIR